MFVCYLLFYFIFFLWSLGVIHLCEHNWVKLKKKRQQKILEQLHVLFMVCVEVLQIPTMFHISQTPSLRLDPGLEGTASCKSGLHHSCPIRNKNDITMKRFSPASPCFWVCVCVCATFSLFPAHVYISITQSPPLLCSVFHLLFPPLSSPSLLLSCNISAACSDASEVA